MTGDGLEIGSDDEIALLRAQNEQLQTNLRTARETADQRLIQAELRAEAFKAGMVDLDGLRLIDTTDIAIDEAGDVRGVASAMTKMRRDKPWLFASQNSSSAGAVPKQTPARTKLATEMTLEEWRAARADLLRRR